MLKRIITGACYVVVLVGLFLLREFVDNRIFHVLTFAFVSIGTYELAKMLKPYAVKNIFYYWLAFGIIFVPFYAVAEYLIMPGWGWLIAIDFIAISVIAVCCFAFIKKLDSQTFLASILPFIYPALFLTFMLAANDMSKHGFIVLLMAFVVSPLSDTFAFFVGKSIGGKKLCPKLSPKKTWSGAIGGTVGGALGGVLVYLIFRPTIKFFAPVLYFILVGLIASVINIFGDLFESYIKRKTGVKDSGKILPGHGGVLDRIDGTMFVIVFVYLAFIFV